MKVRSMKGIRSGWGSRLPRITVQNCILEMSMLLQLPSDIAKYIVSEWFSVVQICKLYLAFVGKVDRKSYEELLKNHSGLSFETWQLAENIDLHNWISHRKIKVIDLKFSNGLLGSDGSPLVPIDVEHVESVSVRTRKSVSFGHGMNDFLLSCHRLRTLRCTSIDCLELVDEVVLSRLKKMAVGPASLDSSLLFQKMCQSCRNLTYLKCEVNVSRIDIWAEMFRQNSYLTTIILMQSQSVLNDIVQYCPNIRRVEIYDRPTPVDLLLILNLLLSRPLIQRIHIYSSYNCFVYLVNPKNQNPKRLKILQGNALFESAVLRELLFAIGAVSEFYYVVHPKHPYQPCVIDWLTTYGLSVLGLDLQYATPGRMEEILLLCPNLVKLSVVCKHNICPLLLQCAGQLTHLYYHEYQMTPAEAHALLVTGTNLLDGVLTVCVEGERQAYIQEVGAIMKRIPSFTLAFHRYIGSKACGDTVVFSHGVIVAK